MPQQKRTGLLWGLYARISNDKNVNTDDEGIGVDNQLDVLREWVHRKDPQAQIVEVYVDNDIPASGKMTKRKTREEFDRARTDARRGHIQACAAWHIDRYTRRPREIEDLVDIADQHGTLWGTVTGEIDLTTAAGRLFARMLGNWAAYEGEHKTERMQLRFSSDARAGKVHTGGMRCYGYTDDDTGLIPVEVAVIREMAERVLPPDPESVRSLTRLLKERGVKTVLGNNWTSTSIVRLLTNPRLRGARAYHGEVVKEEVFPRVFSDEEFARIVTFLEDPERKKPDEPVRKYLATGGIAICGLCGKRLQAQPSNTGRRGYVCRTSVPYGGCGKIRIQAEAFEEHIAAEVLARFASPKVRARVEAAAHLDAGEEVGERILAIDAELADLGRDLARKKMSKVAFRAAENVLTEERNELVTRMRAAERGSLLPPGLELTPSSLASWWTHEETSLEQQRALIMSVLDHAVVSRAVRRGFNGYEPDRVDFIWK
ncbi:recombinase family protein [Nonomuraea sp. NPDC026600]|uniref:recombinase family protein n=1 Tax=Nonomuraea sp. NPDC026600 TaxID=3155363 RepID=UPI0033E40F0E